MVELVMEAEMQWLVKTLLVTPGVTGPLLLTF